MRILLVGPPNCGKTTLFNALTGAWERTGNRAGVTVTAREKRIRRWGHTLVDLPGLAFWESQAKDGTLTRAAVEGKKANAVVLVVDALAPLAGLRLLPRLAPFGLPVVVAVNRMDLLGKKGMRADLDRLGTLLGVQVVGISAAKREGLTGLMQTVAEQKPWTRQPCHGCERAIECAVRASFFGTLRPPKAWERRLMHPLPSVLLSLLLLGLLFCLTFNWAGPLLTERTEALLRKLVIDPLSECASTLAPWQKSLLSEGLLEGLHGVISFLPQILLLFLLMSLLEESGVMSRMAFVFDPIFHRLGLDGKALVPMLLGFGCTATAALSVRSMERQTDRNRTLTALPFLPCAAKLPVMMLVTQTVFPKHGGTVLFALYAAAILMAYLRLRRRNHGTERAVLFELVPLAVPQGRAVVRGMAVHTGHFLKKVGMLLVIFHLMMWGLLHLDGSFCYTAQETESLLYGIGEWVGRVMPFDAAYACPLAISLLVGFLAKEATASTLLLFSSTGLCVVSELPKTSAWPFLLLFLLLPPCMAACVTLIREHSGGMVRSLLWQTGIAFVLASLAFALLQTKTCI